MKYFFFILFIFFSACSLGQEAVTASNTFSPQRYTEVKGQLYRIWVSGDALELKREKAVKEIAGLILKFPKESVGYQLIADQVNLSLAQIDSLLLLIDTSLNKSDYITSAISTRKRLAITETGKRFPPLTLTDTSGKPFPLDNWLGKVVMVDVWSSWCVACRAQIPELRQVYKKYHDKGFDIVGVSMDDDKKKWLDAAAKDKQTWMQFSELKLFSKTDFFRRFYITAIPANYLLDENGMILGQDLSPGQVAMLLEKRFK